MSIQRHNLLERIKLFLLSKKQYWDDIIPAAYITHLFTNYCSGQHFGMWQVIPHIFPQRYDFRSVFSKRVRNRIIRFIFWLFYKPNILRINCAWFLVSTTWDTLRKDYVSLSNDTLQTPKSAVLRLFVVHSALLLSSVYSARIWRIQLIHILLLSPT